MATSKTRAVQKHKKASATKKKASAKAKSDIVFITEDDSFYC